MTEAFLQYVWGQRLYRSANQRTTGGQNVEILNPGRLNSDSGPDFFNAQVRVDGVTWAGNVEIHQTSDDWYHHGHENDPAYDNVILHVVGRSTGRRIVNSLGQTIPEVTLDYAPELLSRYEDLESRKGFSPIRCAALVPDIPSAVKESWLDSLIVERMKVKSDRVLHMLDIFKGDIDQAFFCALARAMGCKVNSEPMEMMVRATPLRALVKHQGELQSEALILGQAGLLSGDPADDYMAALQREYSLLKVKFGLEPIDGSVWKYARLRPQNFPDLRLVQLAAIVRALPGNFASCLSLPLNKVFAVSPSDYWRSHYRLGVEASGKETNKQLGESSRRLLMINAVVPYAFAMGRRYSNEERQEVALDMLRALSRERNAVLDLWTEAGMEVRDEADAQALLHLTEAYCQKGACLRCRFGHHCISRGFTPVPYAEIRKEDD